MVLTFLGSKKELILCCVNRERKELLAKKRTTFNENENEETICA